MSWEESGERNVGYWIGKAYWGQGVATNALIEFLRILKARPLYAHVAKHNVASLRVLQKCGFTISAMAPVSSQAPAEEIEEFLLQLGANECDDAR